MEYSKLNVSMERWQFNTDFKSIVEFHRGDTLLAVNSNFICYQLHSIY